jgi:hypothetical protein
LLRGGECGHQIGWSGGCGNHHRPRIGEVLIAPLHNLDGACC